MRWIRLLMVALMSAAWAQDSAVSVPAVIGQDVYHANKALRRAGFVTHFEQARRDTAAASFFIVVAQSPDSAASAHPGDTVLVKYNYPYMLRFWNPSVVPLLGDFASTASFYKLSKPPHPVEVFRADYPPELRAYNFSGQTDVEALVDFDGSVLAVRVVVPSGYDAADSSACDAALRARFTPAEFYDEPTRVWFPLPYHWQYEESKDPLRAPQKTGVDPFSPGP